MHDLLNLTKKYLPELEKISKSSKKKSFKFKGKQYRLKKKPLVVKRKRFGSARKIAKTVFNSMQAHVDRLTQYSKRYNEISRRNNVYLSSSYVPPRNMSRFVKTVKKSSVSLSQASAKSKKSTVKSKSSVASKNSKKAKKRKSKKSELKKSKSEETDEFDVTHMKRDEFLGYLKNLQRELSAMKIPDLTITLPKKKAKKKSPTRGRPFTTEANFSQDDLSGIARRFNEAYAQANSPIAKAFQNSGGLLPQSAPFNPKGFLEWAQKPLKPMHFPKID